MPYMYFKKLFYDVLKIEQIETCIEELYTTEKHQSIH